MADISPVQAMMAAQMSGSQPYPNTLGDYFKSQKLQMISQMLMQNAGRSTQVPDGWNSMRVVPKMSPLQGIIGALSGGLAGKAMDKSMLSQQKYMQDIYGGGSGSGSTPAPQPQAPVIGDDPSGQIQSAGSSGALVAPGQPAGQPAAFTPSQPASASAIPGTSVTLQQALRYMSAGVPGADKLVERGLANASPTDEIKTLQQAGFNQDQIRDYINRKAVKDTNIPDEAVRPGTRLWNAQQKRWVAANADSPPGYQNVYGDPNDPGKVTGQEPIPGGLSAIAESKGASTAGQISNEYTTLPTSGGGSRIVGGPHTGIQQPTYFPPNSPQSGQANPAATTSPAASPAPATKGPWASMPKLNIPNELGGANDFTKGVLKGAADKHTELSSKYGAESDLADQQLNYYDEAMKSLPNAEVGPISDWMTENRAKLAEWGVSKDLIPGSGKVTPTFTLNKNLLNAALQGAKQTYGARMTSSEVMLQKNEASPSVKTSRDAIASLIGQAKARISYQKQRADDYGTYIQKGGDPNRFEGWYSSKFPLTDFARKYESEHPVSAGDSGAQSAPTKTVGKKTYVQRGNDWFEAD